MTLQTIILTEHLLANVTVLRRTKVTKEPNNLLIFLQKNPMTILRLYSDLLRDVDVSVSCTGVYGLNVGRGSAYPDVCLVLFVRFWQIPRLSFPFIIRCQLIIRCYGVCVTDGGIH